MGEELELTELAGAADADTENVRAWSLYPDDEPGPARWWPVSVAVGLAVAGLVAVTAAVVWVAMRDEGSPEKAAPSSSLVPATQPKVVAAPPPPPVAPVTTPPPTVSTTVSTVTVPPSTITKPAGLPADQVVFYDRQFLAKLQADGWTITSPQAMTKNAHIVCAELQQGQTVEVVNGQLMDKAGMSSTEALMFSSAAMLTYPNCP